MGERWDVLIIGAGPAGLAAALYTARAGFSTLVLEKGLAGGQILLTDWVENYPGFHEGIPPFELMEGFRKHAERYGAKVESDEILEIHPSGAAWRLKGRGKDYEADAVIIATGSAYRRLGLDNEENLTGRGVSYCATCDGAFFRGMDIAIVGGGDNALKEALILAKFGRLVSIIHRRSEFRGEKIYQERLAANEKIRVLRETIIENINGLDRLESLTLRHTASGKISELPVSGLFVSIGTEPLSKFVRGLVDLNEWGQIKVGRGMETSAAGIFAAGDVSDACPKQIATAVGTGVHAALSAGEYLSRF